ncbi:MAG TPA: hypothetical protein DEA55_09795 [Rhodospirillaceae bacterium]|nr:hypothetical protein [Rhodospirillaceae bacterium]
MTKTNQDENESVINNAQDVIEKFGGIRPMASKMSVPVTTVQGWKKRNVIPGTRLEALLKAASEHNVDLGGLLERTDIANQNEIANPAPVAKAEEPAQPKQTRIVPEVRAQEQGSQAAPKPAQESGNDNKPAESADAASKNEKKSGGSDGRPPLTLQNSVEKLFAAAENKAVARSTIINAVLIVVMIAALVALFWPKVEQVEQIQSEVEAVKEEQSLIRGLMPDGLEQRVQNLQEQAKQAQETVNQAVDAAKVISEDVLSENAGSLQERVVRLETHIADLAGGSPQIVAMLQRAEEWQQSLGGQQQFKQAMAELSALVSGLGGSMENFSGALAEAQTQSPALGQTFEGVPQEELQAAAMLLVLSNFRGALNRDNESFESDLQLLTNFVGEDNPELKASIESLAPHARQGILTPQGLSNELKAMAGDAVVASLKGEDITVQERAKARMNELFQIEKNGELITGTDTQATLARSENLLESGEIQAAIEQIQTIQGPAAEVLAPFLDKARASLLAQQVRQIAAQIINLRAFGDKTANTTPSTATVEPAAAPAGTNILHPAQPELQ